MNNIKQWLLPLLQQQSLSVEELANKVGITRTAVYNYLSDRNRPTEQTMKRITEALGVPFEEGLRQYTPKTVGFPAGVKRTREVHVHG